MQDLFEGYEIRALFDSFSDGIVLTDDSQTLRWMNPAAGFILGVPVGDWIGKPVRAMVSEYPELAWIFEDRPPKNLRCWQVLECQNRACPLWRRPFTDCWNEKACLSCQESQRDGAASQGERCTSCRIYNSYAHDREREFAGPNRARILLQVRSTWIQNEQGATIGTLRVLRDVTRDREIARLREDFLSQLSHDLRSPLTSIRSFAEILLNYPGTDPATQREFLSIIREESQRLDQMIQDLVERHQSCPAQTEWKNEEIYLPSLLDRVLLDHRESLQRKGLVCEIRIHPQCPRIWAETDKIYQVVSLLLGKLEQVTPAGGGIWLQAVPIQGQRGTDRNSLVRFMLSNVDPSRQMPESTCGSLEPSQMPPKWAVLDTQRGMGLGFILCKEIIERAGGNLWLENGEEGRGYTFHFVLPSRAGPSSEEPAGAHAKGTVRRARPQIEKAKKQILVVDDEPNQVNALVVALKKEGYRVHSTTSARKALEMAREVKPDLIISDIGMPEMDGYSLFQQLQKGEATKMIPFIFLSAKGDEEKFHGLQIGVDDYLSKPYDIKMLAARVETLLSRVEEYTDLSRFDGLTGALTRKAFQESLEEEISKAAQTKKPLSLCMADLDFFKRVNDSYGHIVGDFVLRSFVHFLLNNLRGEDILARYGGEEFCIIMPGVEKRTAAEILERVRRLLSETPFHYEKRRLKISITSSFGVSGYPEDGTTPEGLIDKSDAALYAAKRAGRDRVMLYGQDMPLRDAEQV